MEKSTFSKPFWLTSTHFSNEGYMWREFWEVMLDAVVFAALALGVVGSILLFAVLRAAM